MAERAVRDLEAKTAAIGQIATGEMVSHFSNEIKYKIRPKLGWLDVFDHIESV